MMESFFPALKTKRTANKAYRSREQARVDVFNDIERFYNAQPNCSVAWATTATTYR